MGHARDYNEHWWTARSSENYRIIFYLNFGRREYSQIMALPVASFNFQLGILSTQLNVTCDTYSCTYIDSSPEKLPPIVLGDILISTSVYMINDDTDKYRTNFESFSLLWDDSHNSTDMSPDNPPDTDPPQDDDNNNTDYSDKSDKSDNNTTNSIVLSIIVIILLMIIVASLKTELVMNKIINGSQSISIKAYKGTIL